MGWIPDIFWESQINGLDDPLREKKQKIKGHSERKQVKKKIIAQHIPIYRDYPPSQSWWVYIRYDSK